MDFTRKTCWKKDNHKTPDLTSSNFAGVIPRESVRITFTYATLNDLNVYGADIQNSYLVAPTTEKHYNNFW